MATLASNYILLIALESYNFLRCKQNSIESISTAIKEATSSEEFREILCLGVEYYSKKRKTFGIVSRINAQFHKRNLSTHKDHGDDDNKNNINKNVVSRSSKCSQVFEIQSLTCQILSYLDTHSFIKCNLINKQWLYDSYHKSSTYYFDAEYAYNRAHHRHFRNVSYRTGTGKKNINDGNMNNGIIKRWDKKMDILRFRNVRSLRTPRNIGNYYYDTNMMRLFSLQNLKKLVVIEAYDEIWELINNNCTSLEVLSLDNSIRNINGEETAEIAWQDGNAMYNDMDKQLIYLFCDDETINQGVFDKLQQLSLMNMKLLFGERSLMDGKVISIDNKFNNLKVLDIEKCYLTLSFWQELATNNKCNLFNLRELILKYNSIDTVEIGKIRQYAQQIGQKLINIEELTVIGSRQHNFQVNLGGDRRTDAANGEPYSDCAVVAGTLLMNLKGLRLKNLDIHFDTNEIIEIINHSKKSSKNPPDPVTSVTDL